MNATSEDPGEGVEESRKPKPVFAPEVPADIRKMLTGKPRVMIRADEPAFKGDISFPAGTTGTVLAWTAGGLVVVAMLFFTLEDNGWTLPDGVGGWLWAVLRLVVALSVAHSILEFHERTSAVKAAYDHHGKYLSAKDWDSDAKKLMVRAQRAVRDVRKAKVTKKGLLDDIQNDVVLPEQLWEIGQVLQQLSALRTKHRKVDAASSEVLAEALAKQGAALQVADEAMERKVAMLEKYADQVREADAVYKAELALQEVLEDRDKYIELLARTESAAQTALIQNLTAEAAELRERLARSIEAARETSQTLALSSDDVPPSLEP